MPAIKRKRNYSTTRRVRRKFPRKRRFRSTKTGTLITREKDHNVTYRLRKKKLPRSKLTLYRTIRNINDKKLGSRTVMFYSRKTVLNTTTTDQIVFDCGLYTGRDASIFERNDINRIVSLENTGNSTAATGETVDDTTKFMFQNGHFELRIRNTSYTAAAGLIENATQYVDIYEMVSSKTWEGASEVSPRACFQTADTDTKALNNATANSMAITNKNVTPWDIPTAFSNYGLKILKKTSYCIENGREISYALHDSKRRVYNKNYIINKARSNLPYATKWLLIIAKAGPNQELGTLSTNLQQELKYEIIRRYNYRIEGFNESRDFYEAQT